MRSLGGRKEQAASNTVSLRSCIVIIVRCVSRRAKSQTLERLNRAQNCIYVKEQELQIPELAHYASDSHAVEQNRVPQRGQVTYGPSHIRLERPSPFIMPSDEAFLSFSDDEIIKFTKDYQQAQDRRKDVLFALPAARRDPNPDMYNVLREEFLNPVEVPDPLDINDERVAIPRKSGRLCIEDINKNIKYSLKNGDKAQSHLILYDESGRNNFAQTKRLTEAAETKLKTGATRQQNEMLLHQIPDNYAFAVGGKDHTLLDPGSYEREHIIGAKIQDAHNLEKLMALYTEHAQDANIARIYFGNLDSLEDHHIAALRLSPHLEHIQICESPRVSSEIIAVLPDSLKSLALKNCKWFDSSAIEHLKARLQRNLPLLDLTLIGCQLTPENIGALGELYQIDSRMDVPQNPLSLAQLTISQEVLLKLQTPILPSGKPLAYFLKTDMRSKIARDPFTTMRETRERVGLDKTYWLKSHHKAEINVGTLSEQVSLAAWIRSLGNKGRLRVSDLPSFKESQLPQTQLALETSSRPESKRLTQS